MVNENTQYREIKVSRDYVITGTSTSLPPEVVDYRNIIPIEDNKVMISKQCMRNAGLDVDVDALALQASVQSFIRKKVNEARDSRLKN